MSRESLTRNNPLLLCAFQALYMSLFPVAIVTLFWRHDLGMSVTTMMLVQACFGLIIALCEFPSGYVADRLGYRRSLVLASAIVAVAWTVYTTASSVVGVIASEMLLGVGFSLISGTNTALLYESLHDEGRSELFGVWYGRMRFSGQIAEGTSALGAGWLYAQWHRLPFAIEIVVWVIAALVALRMVEPEIEREPVDNHLARVGEIVRFATVGSPELRTVILLATAFGLSSFIPVWLVPLYATESGVPVTWIGPIWAVANYSVALGALWADRIGRALGLLPTLLGCVACVGAGYLGLGLSEARYGVAFYFLLTFMRGVNPTLLHGEEQRLIPSRDRASFVSFRSLIFRVGFLLVGPLIGASVDAHGQRPVLLAVGAGLFALTLAGWGWLARIHRGRAQA